MMVRGVLNLLAMAGNKETLENAQFEIVVLPTDMALRLWRSILLVRRVHACRSETHKRTSTVVIGSAGLIL